MIKNSVRFLCGIALAGLVAWAAGVRFHPEVLIRSLRGQEKKYQKIELTSGAVFTGEVLSETGDSLQIKLPEGKMTFSRKEIKTIAELNAGEADASGNILKSYGAASEPFLTYHPSKNIFAGTSKKAAKPAPSQLPLTALSPSKTLTSVDSSALAAAQSAVAEAKKRQREMEARIRAAESGY